MEEDKSFSDALLIVTSAIYVAVLAAAFAGLMAESPTIGKAIYLWLKDFGSVIAGLPVIVAVVVAKQQLDASRVQHEAGTKLQFRDELEGIETAREVALRHKSLTPTVRILISGPVKISSSDIAAVLKCKSPHVIDAFETLRSVVNDGAPYPYPTTGLLASIRKSLPHFGGDAGMAANDVLKAVDDRKKFLRQFLPNLL